MQKVFFIWILLSGITSQAQFLDLQLSRIDSLKEALPHLKNDTERLKLYSDLSFAYVYVNPDSAIRYAAKGIELAKKLHVVQDEIKLLYTTGEAQAMNGNLPIGLELKLEALRKAETLGDSSLIAECNNYLGANYLYSNDAATALTYYNRVAVYQDVPQYLKKYLFGQIGTCYLVLNNLDSAYYYTRLAYDLDLIDSIHWENIYGNLGAIAQKRGNYKEALQFFKIESAITHGPSLGIASTFKDMGQTDSAIYYAKKGLATNDAFFAAKIYATTLLTDIYKSRRQTDSAFKYQELMLALKDSAFSQEKIKQLKNLEAGEHQRQQQLEQQQHEAAQRYQNRIKVYSLIGGLALISIIAFSLYYSNRHKQRTNVLLAQKNTQIEQTLQELKATQAQLIQSEKMASLGELTAGIAHEIQNPLNFVNNFSETNAELIEEAQHELKAGNTNEAISILNDIKANENKINSHGKRADSIVKGMLQHSRTNAGHKEPTDLNKLADEYLRLSYHGLRAKDKTFNIKIETNFDKSIGKVPVVPQEIGRVLLNLFNNAFYAVHGHLKKLNEGYEPTVTVTTKRALDKIEISVQDNGMGISKSIVDKIFQPFFTTKPTGQGTGLGLSLSYDIIKAHGGEIKVESKEGEGSDFIIQLPIVSSDKT